MPTGELTQSRQEVEVAQRAQAERVVTPRSAQLSTEMSRSGEFNCTRLQQQSNADRERSDTGMNEWMDSNIQWFLDTALNSMNQETLAGLRAVRISLDRGQLEPIRQAWQTYRNDRANWVSTEGNTTGEQRPPTFHEYRTNTAADLSRLAPVEQNLRQFLLTYGNTEHGMKNFIRKLAEDCRETNAAEGFNLIRFNQRVEGLQDFLGNFGYEAVQQEVAEYLRTYVIRETPQSSPYRQMIDEVVAERLRGQPRVDVSPLPGEPSLTPQPIPLSQEHQPSSVEPPSPPRPESPLLEHLQLTVEERRRVAEAQREIFEQAGNRTIAEKIALVQGVSQQIDAERRAGQGRINKAIIPEMTETETVQDEYLTFIPKERGKVVTIGDIHADSLSLEQAIRHAGFIENMESANPDMTIVFMGDYVDRGKNHSRTLDILFKLKEKYGNRVIMIKADHETADSISDQTFPSAVLADYFRENAELQQVLTSKGIDLRDFIKSHMQGEIGMLGKFQAHGKTLDEFVDIVVKAFNKEEDLEIRYVWEQKMKEFVGDTTGEVGMLNYTLGAAVYIELGKEMPLFTDYIDVFNKLPRYVVCGNGLTVSHGGPPPVKVANLQTLKADVQTMDEVMVWADPITPESAQYFEEIARSEAILRSEIDNLIAQAQTKTPPDQWIEYHGQNFTLNRLQLAKQNLDFFEGTGFHFNPRRMESRASATDLQYLLSAAGYRKVVYEEDALRQSLNALGGKALVRGHQISQHANGGQPFAEAICYDIHSTGGKAAEAESFYWATETDPKFAIFDKETVIDVIDPAINIVSVWSEQTVNTPPLPAETEEEKTRRIAQEKKQQIEDILVGGDEDQYANRTLLRTNQAFREKFANIPQPTADRQVYVVLSGQKFEVRSLHGTAMLLKHRSQFQPEAIRPFITEIIVTENGQDQVYYNRDQFVIESHLFDVQLQLQREVSSQLPDFESMTQQERAVKFREWYTLDLQVLNLIRKLSNSTNRKAINQITALLQQSLAQRNITNIPTEFRAMLTLWQERRSAEIKKVLAEAGDSASYIKFQQDHPYVVDGVAVQRLPDEQVSNGGGTFTIEQRTGQTEKVTVLSVKDKGEDAIGTKQNPDGSISIALADGVSNSVLPKVASRIAIESTLQSMETDTPSTLGTIAEAHKAIQDQNLAIMAVEYRNFLFQQLQALDKNDPLYIQKLTAFNTLLTQYSEKIVQSIATTTLVQARYDKAQAKVDFALRGDSRIVIFRADGTFTPYEGRKNAPQLAYHNPPNTPFTPAGEIVESLSLGPNDVILVSSDGLDDRHLAEVNQHLIDQRLANNTNRLDQDAVDFIKTKIRQENLNDDISIVTIQHTT